MKKSILFLSLFILLVWIFLMYYLFGHWIYGSKKTTLVKPGTVALTFDDGPTKPFTPQILSILKQNNIHATFFFLGSNAKKHPDLVREAYKEGNAIACHGVMHLNLLNASKEELESEVRGCKEIISKIIGKDPICYRPAYNKENEEIKNYIQSRNMRMIKVDIDSSDWTAPGVTAIVENTLNEARSGGVITFHDGTIENEDRSQTVVALPLVIQKLREKGFGFSRICYP